MYHDIIPWDDDVDMVVPYRDLPRWKKYFREPENRQKLNVHGWGGVWQTRAEWDLNVLQTFPANASDKHWYKLRYKSKRREPCHKLKVFYSGESGVGRKSGSHKWRYPFIDVIFYKEDKTHFWLHGDTPQINAPLSAVYPLVDRPYGRLMIKAPFDPSFFLKG